MKYIKIQNDGMIDPKLIPLMGGTTKKDDHFKIGQFGTGLKYALSFLVRNKLDFKMFVGESEVKITTTNEEIAGQSFTIIYIDGERTSITAQMGYDWTHWMIIREIWCNALDEGGASRSVTSEVTGTSGKTTIYIEYSIEFAKVWNNWSNYFIQDFEPLYSNTKFSIHPGTGKLKLYKNGVLIHESSSDRISVFNYDIKDAEINELREFKGNPDYEIYECITQITDKRIIQNFLECVTEESYEAHAMDYSWSFTNFNQAWRDTIGNAKIIHKEAVNTIIDRGLSIDISSVIVVPKNLYKKLTKAFEGIGLLRTADKINDFYEIYDEKIEAVIKQGLAILETCEYFIDPELKFVYGIFGDKTTLAKIHIDKKEILVSEKMRDKSLFEVVAMLIEENEHYKTGLSDETRAFQQHFINLYTKTLLSKNERQIF